MSIGIIMPKAGISVETCILTGWNKKVGSKVKKGEILFSYETDKTSFDEEAPQDGTLLAAFFEEGDDVPVMVNVCVLGDEGEDISSFAPKQDSKEAALKPQPENQPEAENISSALADDVIIAAEGGHAAISPRARMTARNMGIALEGIDGTGPNGRIIERDIHIRAAQPSLTIDNNAPLPSAVVPSETAFTDVKLTNIRKIIAKNMVFSLASMAQLTHTLSFDATDVMALRAIIKTKGEVMGYNGITLNDIILYGVSRTLPEFPELNAHMIDDSIRLFHQVNLGMAVDTKRGLMVPSIFGADKMSLKQLSERTKALASDCQNGSIDPALLRGGTFTVSNLGSFGIEHFTPIINPPQTGILGVGTIVQKVREVNGQLNLYPSIELSLTYDHRAIDGAPASRFLKKLKENMENFSLLLLK